MANTKVRVNRAAGLAALAAAALLVGPHSTFGLDTGAVTGTVNNVTSTTQAVVETTQQTVEPTVTTVETTTQALQQTVETTVQQAPAPVSTATPVTAAPAPTSAPTQTSSPVRRQSAAVADSPVRRVTDKVRWVERAAGSKLAAVKDRAGRKTERAAATTRDTAGAKTRSRTTRSDVPAERPGPLASCLPIELPQLLVALDLAPLVSVLCAGIELPTRSGPVNPGAGADSAGIGTSPVSTIAHVLGVVTSVATPTNPFAVLAHSKIRLAGEQASGEASAAAHGAGGSGVLGASAAGGSSATPLSPGAAYRDGRVHMYGRGAAMPTTRHDPVQGHSDGVTSAINATNALMMILVLDLALLAALFMWRAARRWVIPRLV